MKTKHYILLLGFSFMITHAQPSKKITKTEFEKMANDYFTGVEERLEGKLVSDTTFAKLIVKDFTNVQTGDKLNKVNGKYAILDLNSQDKRFSFSPFVYNYGNHFFSVNFTGILSNSSFFNLKDRNRTSISIDYTFLFGSSRDFKKPALKDKKLCKESLYDKIKGSMLANWNTIMVDDLKFDCEIESRDKDSLMNELREKTIKYEIARAEEYWTSKKFYWITLNLKPYNNDNFHYVVENDPLSYDNPYEKSLNVFSVNASGNFYYESKRFIFNPSVFVKSSRKHNLSEIYTTKTWNKISNVTDNVYFSEDTKEVYVLSENKFNRLFLIDYGFQLVGIVKPFNLGLDVGFTNTQFMKPGTTNGVGTIQKFDVGFIISLKDAKGLNTINVIPFFEHKQFLEYEKASENVYGIKFSLPFNF